MPTIIATPGAVDANSFTTRDKADAYHDTRPSAFVTSWVDDADPDDKDRALIQATELLSFGLPWTGTPTTPEQALPFPRMGLVTLNGAPVPSDSIPVQLERATAEFARQLLENNRTADNDVQRQGITDLKAGPISLSFREVADDSSVPSVIPDAVKLMIPSGWYAAETVDLLPFKAL